MPPFDVRRFGASARPSHAAVWVVLGIQGVSMLALAAVLGTWHDEEYTLATTAHGVLYAFHRAIDFELQAPLYFVLLAALRTVTTSVLAARAVSVACAVGAAYVVGEIARRIAPARDPWPFVALVAFSPFTVFAALEIRLYAFALLLSALCWLTFYDGYFAGKKRGARLAFVGLALASLYTQYFIAFELIAFGVGLLVMRRYRSLGAYALAGAAVAIGFAPMALVLHAQVGGAFSVPDAKLPGLSSVFLHPLIDFIVPLDFRYTTGRFGHLCVLLLFVVVPLAIFVGRPRIDVRIVAVVAMAAVVEAIYAILADVLRYELVVPRHFVALFVPEVVAAYALVCAFASPRARMAALGLAIVISLATAATLVTQYGSLAKRGDWPRVGAFLSRVARPGDTIAVTEADALPAFTRYYHGPARVVPFPRPLPPDRYDVDAMLVHSVADGEAELRRLPRTGQLWLVIYGGCDASDRLGCRELQRALDARERVVETHAFFDNRVLRLERR